MAQQLQGIDPLMDAFFGFLQRRTDFFSGASMEQIEKTVLGVVRRHASKAKLLRAEAEAQQEKERKAKEARRAEEEMARRKRAEQEAATAAASKSEKGAEVVSMGEDGSFDVSAASEASLAAAPAPAPVAPAEGSGGGGEGGSEEGGEDGEEAARVIKPGGLDGNGGETDRYKWTQTLSEVTVAFKLPEGVAGIKGKDVVYAITPTKLKIGLKGHPMWIDAALHKRVLTDDCYWTLEEVDGRKVVSLYLAKSNSMEWWSAIAEGEPEIDTSKVEPENSKLSDLDGETRKTVEKMMFDQRAKAMGMPTSDELEKQRVLEKFMKQHPEMDFSKAKMM
jgi:hypothetical protein